MQFDVCMVVCVCLDLVERYRKKERKKKKEGTRSRKGRREVFFYLFFSFVNIIHTSVSARTT